MPASIVEPVIALSISVVAGLHLWRLWQRGSHAADVETVGHGRLGLDARGRGSRWSSLRPRARARVRRRRSGSTEAFSWTLLSSLLVFNLGIETVQLAIILAVFPVLALLRRRAPLAGLSATGAIAAGVCAMGLVWFVQRAVLSLNLTTLACSHHRLVHTSTRWCWKAAAAVHVALNDERKERR